MSTNELPYCRDPAARHLCAIDVDLARTIERVGPMALQLRHLQSPFEALLRAIVGQQLSTSAARTIHGRVVDLFDEDGPAPEPLLALEPDVLRGAGLSRAKTVAARDLAHKVLDGTVPTLEAMGSLTDEALVERLTAVRGVGPWTVQMLLIFRLGRPDVLPATDLGIRKGCQRVFGLDEIPPPKQILARGERWGPYRSAASWYLWRALEL